MEVRLSPEQARFVGGAVERGLYASPEQAVETALRLLGSQGATGPGQRAVALGLEQALAGRSAALTADDVVRRALRKGKPH